MQFLHSLTVLCTICNEWIVTHNKGPAPHKETGLNKKKSILN